MAVICDVIHQTLITHTFKTYLYDWQRRHHDIWQLVNRGRSPLELKPYIMTIYIYRTEYTYAPHPPPNPLTYFLKTLKDPYTTPNPVLMQGNVEIQYIHYGKWDVKTENF